MAEKPVSLYLALVHYPVLNRRGETIASAITNLDLHDLGRLVCTYGMGTCYIVTPLKDQSSLAQRLISHWCDGVGGKLHPDRGRALRCLRVVESIASVRRDIEDQWGQQPQVWATAAGAGTDVLRFKEARRHLARGDRPYLVLLGTGWGLAPEVLGESDAVLEAIRGLNGYNHLSVRCAAAIFLDRLLSAER